MNEVPTLRCGAGSMRRTSRVPSPAAAGLPARRFAFQFVQASSRETPAQRRLAVAEYLEGWPSVRIVAEGPGDGKRRRRVVIALPRPLPLDAVRDYLADCPHVVRGTVEIVAE